MIKPVTVVRSQLPFPRVPTIVVVSCLLVLIAALTVMFLGGWVSGITWDEKSHVIALQMFFQHGWNVSTDALVNGDPDPNYIWGIYVYGPVAELVGHAFNVVIGVEQWGTPLVSIEAYAGRHIATSFMACIGIAAAAGMAKVLLNSWRWALVAAATLASVPLWSGHGMFNIKDTPVASGYSLATLGLILIFSPNPISRKFLISGWVSLVGGVVLASGTRAAVGAPIAGTAILCAVALSIVTWTNERGLKEQLVRPLSRLGHAVGALATGYLILVWAYPNAFSNPVRLAYEALVVSSRFPFDETVRTNGRWVPQPPDILYLPTWFTAQLPVLVLVGTLAFSIWWTVRAFQVIVKRTHGRHARLVLMTVPVVAQALLLPAVASLGDSNLYNGSRQFLFVVPATAVLAVVGIAIFARRLQAFNARQWQRILFWCALVAGLMAPTFAQVQLFPYTYTFFNFPTSLVGVDGRWSVDYWRQSGRELAYRIPAEGVVSCGYEQYRKDAMWSCFNEPQFSEYENSRGIWAKPFRASNQHFWYVRENAGWVDNPQGCQPFDAITRPLFLTTVTIAQILQCENALAASAFDSPAEGQSRND